MGIRATDTLGSLLGRLAEPGMVALIRENGAGRKHVQGAESQ
jgi:hypothetical protein